MPGVLVTGAAGFIGSNLVDELLTQGHEVTTIDDFSQGKIENLSRWKGHPKLEVHRGTILDFDLVRRAADHKEWIFHLAADSRIQPSLQNPLKSFQTNMIGTANVLQAAVLGGVKRVVYSASSSAYGRNKVPCVESMKPDCLNPYSLSKKSGEELMDLYNNLYGLSTVSLRYFNVYGPRHPEDGDYATVIAIFRKQMKEGNNLTVVGDGNRRRDFTFVSDVVRANILAAMNRDATGVFNIGTGKNYSILEVAKMIAKGDESKIEFIADRIGEAKETLADISKARDLLGFRPMISLEQGLEVLDLYEKKNSSSIILASR